MSRAAPTGEYQDQHGPAQDALRELDGTERIAALPHARTIALAPGLPDTEEPTYVFIIWAPNLVECPFPGSAIWRAVLEQFLANEDVCGGDEPTGVPADSIAAAVASDLQRFPSLATWIRWRDHDRNVPERQH